MSSPAFREFESRFLDAYWHQYPSAAITIGYGRYYEDLVIPDSISFRKNIAFSDKWLDSLRSTTFDSLDDNSKISYLIIENQLLSDKWYADTLKSQEWNPAQYNLSNECYYLLTQPYAPLDSRLRTLSQHLSHSADYYSAALHTIQIPTNEQTELAIKQNQGGLDVFGSSMLDSITHSGLSAAEKDTIGRRVATTVEAIRNYCSGLQKILSAKDAKFRDFRLGKELYNRKFVYDLVTSFTPQEIFDRSMADKTIYHNEMFGLAVTLWPKYCAGLKKPADSLDLINTVIEKISLHHAKPADVMDTLKQQVHELEYFIVTRKLFKYDTNSNLKVRAMPAYMSGFALANAEFIPPYQKQGITYFNIDDVTKYPPAKAESVLREYNNYSLQFLTIHEAMPGHCLQGIYSNNHAPDIVKSVFQNGTMIEGWAVYAETMMLENGWGNHSPEMQLIHDKWKLRELCNVIIDYGLHCLNYSKSDITALLKKEAFQTDAQVEEKYHRAVVSQVQLCSYYSGMLEVMKLREDYKKKKGDQYDLEDFHEKFLSYGSAPVKYIREMMMK